MPMLSITSTGYLCIFLYTIHIQIEQNKVKKRRQIDVYVYVFKVVAAAPAAHYIATTTNGEMSNKHLLYM